MVARIACNATYPEGLLDLENGIVEGGHTKGSVDNDQVGVDGVGDDPVLPLKEPKVMSKVRKGIAQGRCRAGNESE